MCTGGLFPTRVNRPELEADHSPTRKYGSIYPLTHTPSWRIVKHRDNFTFIYSNVLSFQTADEKAKISEQNGSRFRSNSICSSFPHASNFDLLLSFPNILTLPHSQNSTMLQAVRCRDRVPKRWILSIYPVLPVELWPWGRLSL
jgi:hypothetical protein